jgi:hypothetical protein
MIPLALRHAPRPHDLARSASTARWRVEAEAAQASTQPTTMPSFGSADDGYPGSDDALMELPGNKLDGALLSRRSAFPLLFALLAPPASSRHRLRDPRRLRITPSPSSSPACSPERWAWSP